MEKNKSVHLLVELLSTWLFDLLNTYNLNKICPPVIPSCWSKRDDLALESGLVLIYGAVIPGEWALHFVKAVSGAG